MAADDLRERIRRGDCLALLDPALLLYALAEPTADWWQEGLQRCAVLVLQDCTEILELQDCTELPDEGREKQIEAIASWGRAWGPEVSEQPSWKALLGKLHKVREGVRLGHHIKQIAALPVSVISGVTVVSCTISLALHLRRLMPTPLPPTVDPALDDVLAVLERFATG